MFGVDIIAITLSLLFIVGNCIGSPIRAGQGYAIKESHPVPKRWKRVGAAPANHFIRLHIGLKQEKFEELERHLYEVSDPSHKRYGQHLSEKDVSDLIKPSSDTISKVHEWLEENGIEATQLDYSPAQDWINVLLPLELVEKLLGTKYFIFEDSNLRGNFLVRTSDWSLPIHLHEYITTVQPTNSFFQPESGRSTLKSVTRLDQGKVSDTAIQSWSGATAPTLDEVCNASLVTPICLRTLYGTYEYVPQAPDKTTIGLTDYLNESNNRSDTRLFLDEYRTEAVSAADDFTVISIANGSDQQTPDNAKQLKDGTSQEGNLDVEMILSIVYPIHLTAYSTGGSPPYTPDLFTTANSNEPYLTWLQYVLSQPSDNLPQVISTSYGDDEQTVPYSYARSVCNGFAQLGARGVTVLFSSGDEGVGRDSDCFTNDGSNIPSFLAMFPASCPYVTSVGATMNFNPEVVGNDTRNGFNSGGGFSNYFPRPEYQQTVLKTYIDSLGDHLEGLYNKSGRGYPDLSAQGYRYSTIWNGTLTPLDGTSASCPTMAAVLALVNDALLAAGKSSLGFLNPWLYAKGYQTFTDITIGSTWGCNTMGFPAQSGWDAATGFGTPNFAKLKEAALACAR